MLGKGEKVSPPFPYLYHFIEHVPQISFMVFPPQAKQQKPYSILLSAKDVFLVNILFQKKLGPDQYASTKTIFSDEYSRNGVLSIKYLKQFLKTCSI